MKYIFIILFVLTFRNIYSQDIFEFKPINPTILSFVKTEDGSIVYGCEAGVIVKEKNGKIQMRKVFDYGEITYLTVQGKYILGLNYNKIISSSDNGDNWKSLDYPDYVRFFCVTNKFIITESEIYDHNLNLLTKTNFDLQYGLILDKNSNGGHVYYNDTLFVLKIDSVDRKFKIVYLDCRDLESIKNGFQDYISLENIMIDNNGIEFSGLLNENLIYINRELYRFENRKIIKKKSSFYYLNKYKDGFLIMNNSKYRNTSHIKLIRMDKEFNIIDSISTSEFFPDVSNWNTDRFKILNYNDSVSLILKRENLFKVNNFKSIENISCKINNKNLVINNDIPFDFNRASYSVSDNGVIYTSYDNFIFKTKSYNTINEIDSLKFQLCYAATERINGKELLKRIYKYDLGDSFNKETRRIVNQPLKNNFYISHDMGLTYEKVNTDIIPDSCYGLYYIGNSNGNDYFYLENSVRNTKEAYFIFILGSKQRLINISHYESGRWPANPLDIHLTDNGFWYNDNYLEPTKYKYYDINVSKVTDSIELKNYNMNMNKPRKIESITGFKFPIDVNKFEYYHTTYTFDSTNKRNIIVFRSLNYKTKEMKIVDSISFKMDGYVHQFIKYFKLATGEHCFTSYDFAYIRDSKSLSKIVKFGYIEPIIDYEGNLRYCRSDGYFFLTKKNNTSVDEKSNYSLDLNTLSFPNPALNQLTIELNSSCSNNSKLLILDLTGNIVAEYPISSVIRNNKLSIDISDLSKGAYLYQVLDNNLIHTQGKFIKE